MPANFTITPLALVEPVERGSRGRNRTFTARSLQVHVHLPAGPGEGPAFCAIAAYSQRPGDRAPAEIALSLGDAVELARLIQREVQSILHGTCFTCGLSDCDHLEDPAHPRRRGPQCCANPTKVVLPGTCDASCAACGADWREEAQHAPAAP